MSIGMDRFSSEGQFLTYDPFAGTQSRISVFQMQCRSCGFEPEDAVVAPRVCPQWHSESWESFAKPGSILDNANRY